ncbi:MAG: phosphotransferase family protein [Wenzhouxiangellaceae bacterium]
MTQQNLIDQPREQRAGEALDIAAVDAWLKTQALNLSGVPTARQYSGGASNWTYCLHYPERDLILRRPPAGTKAKSAHDMGREFQVQQALKPHYPYVPEMLAWCQDESVIGAEFYVMERLQGIIPRANLPRGLQLDQAQVRQLCTNVIDRLVDLHQIDYRQAGLEFLFKGDGYARRQIEGWCGRFRKARTWNVRGAEPVMRWLNEHIPEDSGHCVIHNDWRFDNVVLNPDQPTEVIGVLDWEMATIGDPLMDLGSALAYWVQADDDRMLRATRRQPTHLPGMMSRQEVVEYYLQRSGRSIDNWVFYEVYGLFRLVVIIQQIYYRYHHKQTSNPAFKRFWLLANYLLWRCRRIIRQRGR